MTMEEAGRFFWGGGGRWDGKGGKKVICSADRGVDFTNYPKLISMQA